jgi:hypothetical protein
VVWRMYPLVTSFGRAWFKSALIAKGETSQASASVAQVRLRSCALSRMLVASAIPERGAEICRVAGFVGPHHRWEYVGALDGFVIYGYCRRSVSAHKGPTTNE